MSGMQNEAPNYAGHSRARDSGKHTTGPWVPEWELSRGAFCQVAAFSTEGNRVLRCAIESFRPVEDARLIAAAPELLEALRTLMAEYIADNPQSSGADNPDCSIAMIAAHAAIAKAEGRKS